MIQVYGCFEGWLSHAQVCRGVVAGLMQNGLDVCIWNVAPVASGYGGYSGFEDFGVEPLVDLVADADQALYLGGYPPFAIPWMTGHRRKYGLFITESSTVPMSWADTLRTYSLVCVPSRWVREAYISAGVPLARVCVVSHGLHPVYANGPAEPLPAGPLRLLHVAGAASFLERKGTDVLLRAFAQAFPHGEELLILRTPDTPRIQRLLAKLPAEVRRRTVVDTTLDTWGGLPPATMRELISSCHAVVQPSRAEAFGIVPLEARALGRTVVLTAVTGHTAHAEYD